MSTLPPDWLAIELESVRDEIASWTGGLRASFEEVLAKQRLPEPPTPSPLAGGVGKEGS